MLKPKTPFNRSLAVTALAVMLFSVGILPGAAFAQTTAEAAVAAGTNYVIKLRSNEPEILQNFGTDITRKFAFSSEDRFQNIYGFRSSAPLGDLEAHLAGRYDYLQADSEVTARAVIETKPDDPGFTDSSTDVDRQWALPKVGFPQAWRKTTGSNEVTVAVVDTGIDETHADLSRTNFDSGINIITGDTIPDDTDSDDNGHGTLVTGIIAAKPNNSRGIAGTNWHVTIVPVKALNARGSGSSSNVSEAIVWAADHGADIINLSLGGLGFGHDTILSDAITYAYRKGVLLVSAAGNDVAVTGGNLDLTPVFPICDDNGENMILGVTASDVTDRKPTFANYGKSCIDVSAPGKRILSTTNHDPATGAPAPNAYAYASGTSMAVPYVVGQAALLKALFPTSTNRQLRDRIIASADNIDALNLTQCQGSCSGLLGSGRINVVKSMEEEISGPDIVEGDVIRVEETRALYYISGGKRRPLSSFVRQQRFATAPIKEVNLKHLASFPEGPYAEPLDGTLIKEQANPTVYYMSKGLRLPVTYQVFVLRHLDFIQVHTLTLAEMNSWLVGSFLTPPEGTLVRTANNPTVYWVVGGVLHPVNNTFYRQRSLQIFPIATISDDDLKNFPKGDPFIL